MKVLLHILLVFCLVALTTGEGRTAPFGDPVLHRNYRMIPGGCAACHAGSNMKRAQTEACLQCHGSLQDLEKAERKKLLGPFYRAAKTLREIDLRQLLEKRYRHPVGANRGVHSANEELPERDASAIHHVECADCHSPHHLKADRKLDGLKGVDKGGLSGVQAAKEYEVCFNCHADSANLPVAQTNKRIEFDERNPSYHPVVAEGRNSFVPSLVRPYTERYSGPGDVSIIKCTDCHGNNDRLGPQGPHASDYEFILKRQYSLQDGMSERPQDYDLCYTCHKRSSILGDVSFRYHSLHIQGDIVRRVSGTSCYTCHDAHGSTEFPHLIRFNEYVVFRGMSSMELKFVDKGEFKGECYLRCHDVEHNPKSY